MKIAFYCTGNIWQSGGGATVLKNILKEAANNNENEKLLYLSDYVDVPSDIENGFKVIKLKTPRHRLLLEMFDQVVAPFILMKASVDRVICLNSIVPLLYPKRVDVYFQMRMFYFEELDSLSKKIKNFLGKLSLKKATSVYIASKDHKNDLLDNLDLDKGKLKVVYLGVNHSELSKYRENNDSLNNTTNVPYFLFISVIRPYKNLHRLIEAYIDANREIGDKLPELRIIGAPSNYVGMDEYMSDIHEKIQNSNTQSKITFLGSKPHKIAMEQLSNSQALIFPTLFEGFGLPLLEAMACKVPVVVSNRNSLPEIGGKFVEYIEPECVDDIKRKLLEVSLKGYSEQNLVRAYERAQLFNWSKTANALLEDKEYLV